MASRIIIYSSLFACHSAPHPTVSCYHLDVGCSIGIDVEVRISVGYSVRISVRYSVRIGTEYRVKVSVA